MFSYFRIPDNSCPCSLIELSKSKEVVMHAAEYAVAVLNQNLAADCKSLKLAQVTGARQQRTAPWSITYIVRFTVSPSKAQFEAVLSRKFSSLFSLSPNFQLLQEIVQINKDKELSCILKSSKGESDIKRMETDVDD